MKILSVGRCPLCSKQIWKTKPPSISITKSGLSIRWKFTPYEMNEHGTHFWALLTDGSRMRIAICLDCLSKLTDEQVKKIFSDITFTKLKAIEKDKREDVKYRLFDAIRDIQIWRWSVTEQELVGYLNEKNNNIERSAKSS